MRVTLALGGGAGLGWAHIGVIQAVEEAGIGLAGIAGTSIGAIAAAAAAAGKLPELERIARGARWRTVLRYIDPHWRRGGILGARQIERELEEHFGALHFETLAIPVAAVAADLVSGETVVLRSGPLVPAIRASMSLPGIFPPVRQGDRLLIDGGAAVPIPVGAARLLAPDAPCVAISLQNDYPARARASGIAADGSPPSSLAVLKASVGLSFANFARYTMEIDPPDVLLNLPVGHIDIQNFTRAEELIAIGRRETRSRLPDILARLEERGLTA